jgi:hypothetical protein
MTHRELILDCLRLGLDGEKVDYEWESKEESVFVAFEDGTRVQVVVR